MTISPIDIYKVINIFPTLSSACSEHNILANFKDSLYKHFAEIVQGFLIAMPKVWKNFHGA